VNPESETIVALKRAGARVAFHLLKAGVETLKAVEAVIDELGKVGADRPDLPEDDGLIHIEIE
jgi:hypothetical protein